MAEESWRPPTPAERVLVERWVHEWNMRVNDHASVDSELLVRASCSCGTCPSFSAKPLVLDPAFASEGPLSVEGDGHRADGTPAAGLIVFGLEQGAVDFEIYPLDGEPVALEELTFDFVNYAD